MQICRVDILNFIFRLGVIFAIFGFLWFLINLGVGLIRGNRNKTIQEAYILKFARYLFMVDVTILFCINQSDGELSWNKTIIAGLVLLMYFLGKLQNAQLRSQAFKFYGNAGMGLINQFKPIFNLKAEAFVISLSVLIFILLILFPQYAANPISTWFYESIVDIEDTPVFGFIFKVIGFFFVLSIFMRLAQAFTALLAGQSSQNPDDHFGDDNNDNDDDFDDYEEIK